MNKSSVGLALLALLVVGGVIMTTSQDKSYEYEAWKSKFGVTFSAAEDIYRKVVFHHNLDTINSHNQNKDRTYDMAVNQFAALTDAEFAAIYLSPKPYNPEWENTDSEFKKLGADIDWVAKGMVSPVKNQGQCGSCWAFSAVGVLESFALFKGQIVNLSEQQLVDCSRSYGNQGCNGGFNYKGLEYVKDHGLTTAAAYPYVAKTQGCKVDGGSFRISSVPSAKGCPGLQTAVASRPVGVSVDANNWSRYGGGIFNNCKASLDHDVLMVGYTDTYWKIKNSWGSSWGENGFIRLAAGNTCGVCNDKSPWVQ